jgi:putative transposase
MPRGKAEHAEQIIPKLREVEVELGRGKTVAEAVKKIGVTEQTYCRWKKKFGGLRIDQAKRLKDLEKENSRLKRLLADAELDKAILREPAPRDLGLRGTGRPDRSPKAASDAPSRSVAHGNRVLAPSWRQPYRRHAARRGDHRRTSGAAKSTGARRSVAWPPRVYNTKGFVTAQPQRRQPRFRPPQPPPQAEAEAPASPQAPASLQPPAPAPP